MIYQEKNYSYNQNRNQLKVNPFQLKIIDNSYYRISLMNQALLRKNNEINIRRS